MPVSERPQNAFYAQSGGVTAVINNSAAGVIETVARNRHRIGKVLAGRNGIIGALREELIDTSRESAAAIAGLRSMPSGAFGSCRYKLKSIEESRAEYLRLIEVFQAHNIGYFFYNGGGDSADTCLKVSQLSRRMGYPIQAIHIPKTVDNDLPITDNCPGFGSVAKYVAISTLEASMDVASMCESSTKVFVLEVMGRHAGWIAAAAGLANRPGQEIPLIILFPEIRFNKKRFLAAVREKVRRFGYVSIVVSEGVRDYRGRFLSDAGTRDAFGHAQLGGAAPVVAAMVREATGYKYHWAVADYLQRSARHVASLTDIEQAYAVGEAAVDMALRGRNAVMVAIRRKATKQYRWEIAEASLARVANREKMLPRSYITADGFGITPRCRSYLEPLISGEDHPRYRGGLPVYPRLKNIMVAKKLNSEFRV